MCLAVPARIVSREGERAMADMHGNRVCVAMLLVPDAQVGDWVLIHAGFAIQRLDREVAERTWSVLREAAAVAGVEP